MKHSIIALGWRFALLGLVACLVSGCYAKTRAPGGPVASDKQAAAMVGVDPKPEVRPDNADENARVPTASELAYFRFVNDEPSNNPCTNALRQHVTGYFPWIRPRGQWARRPRTEEVLRWVAFKWGIDEDLVKAAAVKESTWRMSQLGDFVNWSATSFGILQVKTTAHAGFHQPTDMGGRPARGGLARASTAFNADYWGFIVRSYYDGCEKGWANTQGGDIYAAMGAWFNPNKGADNSSYIASLKRHFAEKPWRNAGF